MHLYTKTIYQDIKHTNNMQGDLVRADRLVWGLQVGLRLLLSPAASHAILRTAW